MADLYAPYLGKLQASDEFVNRFWSDAVISPGGNDLQNFKDNFLVTSNEVIENIVGLFSILDRSSSSLFPQFKISEAQDFGSSIADRFRQDLSDTSTFFVIVKLLRKCCFDRFCEIVTDYDAIQRGMLILNEYFDLLEQGAINTWVRHETFQLQRKLREANHFILHEKRRYFTIFNRMIEPAFVFDQNKEIIDVNIAFEKILKVSKGKIIGMHCCDLFGHEICGQCGLEKALQEESSFSNMEAVITVDGQPKDVLFAGTFLGDINGEHAGGIVIIQDVSEKKRYELELQESELKYRSLIENVPNVIWRADKDGNLIFVSPNVEKVLGYSQKEILEEGRKGWFDKIYHGDVDHVFNAFAQLFTTFKKIDISYRFRKKDGLWIWLRDRTGEIYKKDDHLFVDGVVSDITKMKLIEKELEQHHMRMAEMVDLRTEELRMANEQLLSEIKERQIAEDELRQLAIRLKESNAELEQFAHVASHDLKEPLMLISAFAERLSKRCADDLDENGKVYIERIIIAADHLQHLVEALLELARVTTRGNPFEEIDLYELLKEVIMYLEQPLAKANADIQIRSLHTLYGDRTQVYQLFQNIISNALKYKREGENPRVVITSKTIDDDYCEITVKDNGIGFDEQFAEQIFSPFVRLHGRSRYEGTGMGLATCKKIVVRHGGDIIAKSTPDEGSTFIITLPINPDNVEIHNDSGVLDFNI